LLLQSYEGQGIQIPGNGLDTIGRRFESYPCTNRYALAPAAETLANRSTLLTADSPEEARFFDDNKFFAWWHLLKPELDRG
jgi:hypothetical protein